MTKKELIATMVEDGFFQTKVQAEKVVNAMFEKIADKVVSGETVEIHGFGKFETVERAAKEGRNPSTGEKMTIPASKTVKFKVSKALKDAVNK